jgi:hypothetical protein
VKRLIFLHAVLPQPGLSFVDQVKAEPDMFNSATAADFVVPPDVADPILDSVRREIQRYMT